MKQSNKHDIKDTGHSIHTAVALKGGFKVLKVMTSISE